MGTWMYSRLTSGSMVDTMTALPRVLGVHFAWSLSQEIMRWSESQCSASIVVLATSSCARFLGLKLAPRAVCYG